MLRNWCRTHHESLSQSAIAESELCARLLAVPGLFGSSAGTGGKHGVPICRSFSFRRAALLKAAEISAIAAAARWLGAGVIARF